MDVSVGIERHDVTARIVGTEVAAFDSSALCALSEGAVRAPVILIQYLAAITAGCAACSAVDAAI